MARLPRLDLPGVPQHIVQRGNNRLPCFLDDDDRLRYLTLLREALLATGVRLHAYVLMDNHVHLLATPPAVGDVGRMMQRLGRQYVGQFNGRHSRTGTLWEGRYKAGLVDTHTAVALQPFSGPLIFLAPTSAIARFKGRRAVKNRPGLRPGIRNEQRTGPCGNQECIRQPRV